MSKDQEFDLNAPEEEDAVKIIILGDSAVGKTKLLERFLLDKYHKQQLSTYALTIFPFEATVPGMGTFPVRFWDTAGQDIFENIHPSYYFGVHAAILCFDVTRKLTYTNMKKWWDELQAHSPNVPAICVANKIDADPKSTTREYGFAKRLQLPLYYVSASTGVNVVKMFTDAINLGRNSKLHPQDPFMDELMKLIRENKPKSDDDDQSNNSNNRRPVTSLSQSSYDPSSTPSFPVSPSSTSKSSISQSDSTSSQLNQIQSSIQNQSSTKNLQSNKILSLSPQMGLSSSSSQQLQQQQVSKQTSKSASQIQHPLAQHQPQPNSPLSFQQNGQNQIFDFDFGDEPTNVSIQQKSKQQQQMSQQIQQPQSQSKQISSHSKPNQSYNLNKNQNQNQSNQNQSQNQSSQNQSQNQSITSKPDSISAPTAVHPTSDAPPPPPRKRQVKRQ